MVRKQLARQEIITPPETANQIGQRDLLASMTVDQDFPEKVTHCRYVFLFISIAQRSVEEDDTIMSKVTKGKGKTCCKKGKTGKCAKEQDNESTDSFQNYDSRRLLMFLYQGWYLLKEKEFSFLTSCLANFCLTATSLFEIWTSGWSSAKPVAFTEKLLVLFLSSLGLFSLLLFTFFLQGLSSAFDFSMSKDFHV